MERLARDSRAWRAAILAALAAGLVALRSIDPVRIGAWLPFRTACGEWTGLPCIFCGLTRATHQLLNGNLERALYFNWLAFPGLVAAGYLAVALSAEIITRRRFLPHLRPITVTPRRVVAVCAGLLALWILQSTLAVAQHKHELLNPHGLLYATFIRQLPPSYWTGGGH